jgi:hypothetical protein
MARRQLFSLNSDPAGESTITGQSVLAAMSSIHGFQQSGHSVPAHYQSITQSPMKISVVPGRFFVPSIHTSYG